MPNFFNFSYVGKNLIFIRKLIFFLQIRIQTRKTILIYDNNFNTALHQTNPISILLQKFHVSNSLTDRLTDQIYPNNNSNSNRTSICVSVSVYRRLSLTTDSTWFSFKVQLLIGPEKIFNHFGGGYLQPPERNRQNSQCW